MNIEEYVRQLGAELQKTFATETVDELLTETRGHLTDQAEELASAGMPAVESELMAVARFGTVEEITKSLSSEYPPKPPMDPSRLRWLPEALLTILGVQAAFIFWESFKLRGLGLGLQSAVSSYILSTPMIVVPGVTAALTRIRYRRFRVLAMVRRLGFYGMILAVTGIAILTGVTIATRTPLGFSDFMYFAFGAVTILGYGVMEFFARNGKIQDRIFCYAKTRSL